MRVRYGELLRRGKSPYWYVFKIDDTVPYDPNEKDSGKRKRLYKQKYKLQSTKCRTKREAYDWIREREQCSAQINPIEFESVAILTGGDEPVEDIETIETLEPKLTVTTTLSEDEVNIGEEIEINVILKNQDEYDISDLEYNIYFPNNIEIIDKTNGVTKVADHYQYKDSLEVDDEQELYFTIIPKKTGEYEIKELVEFKTPISDDEMSFQHLIKASVDRLRISIGDPTSLIKGEKTELPISLRNPSSLKFKNVDIRIETNLPIGTGGKKLTEILANANIEVLRYAFEAPEGRYFLNITIVYETS